MATPVPWKELSPTPLQVRPYSSVIQPVYHEYWEGQPQKRWPQIQIEGNHDDLIEVLKFRRGRGGHPPNLEAGLMSHLQQVFPTLQIEGQGQCTGHKQGSNPREVNFRGIEIFFRPFNGSELQEIPVTDEDVFKEYNAQYYEENKNYITIKHPNGEDCTHHLSQVKNLHSTLLWYRREFPKVLVAIGRWVEEKGFSIEYL